MDIHGYQWTRKRKCKSSIAIRVESSITCSGRTGSACTAREQRNIPLLQRQAQMHTNPCFPFTTRTNSLLSVLRGFLLSTSNCSNPHVQTLDRTTASTQIIASNLPTACSDVQRQYDRVWDSGTWSEICPCWTRQRKESCVNLCWFPW